MGQADAASLVACIEKGIKLGLDIGDPLVLEPYFSDRQSRTMFMFASVTMIPRSMISVVVATAVAMMETSIASMTSMIVMTRKIVATSIIVATSMTGETSMTVATSLIGATSIVYLFIINS
ncbi:unnamed protein product [[Candida] boidinii]|nr:unnamed protein product [[Candida] boidinii]